MDKIYTDFTEKVLPKINEGLSITKDYFFDLFGRYVKYLIVEDVIYTVVFIAFAIFAYKAGNTFWKRRTEEIEKDSYYSDFDVVIIWSIVSIIFYISSVFLLINAISSIMNVGKDIFVPEIRVYEEISTKINSNSHPDK